MTEKLKTAPVVVCVTAQKICEDMIKVAADIARENHCPLEVLSICQATELTRETCAVLEHLYETSKKYNGEMIIHFNNDVILAAAAHISKAGAKRVVAGVPGDDTNDFIYALSLLLPKTPITVFSRKDNLCFDIPLNSKVVKKTV